MQLHILGSNSAGNGYVLESSTEALILECGMRFKDVQHALNFKTDKITAACVSHFHGDHSKYTAEYAKRGVPIYSGKGTFDLGAEKLGWNFRRNILIHGEIQQIGSFKVMPFNIKHDCANPFGFLIDHPEMGQMVFATDTYYLPYKFDNINHWLIECNYRKDILDVATPVGFNKILRDRTLESHMSYETCKNALLANDLSQCRNIVLIHLSDRNANANEFKKGIETATGKQTFIAKKGLKINLKKIPF